MAELVAKERLQPSLLDRLTDYAPTEKTESREQRVMSYRQLRQSVLRDISWLLNTTAFEALEDLSVAPYVARSVVNYGIPALSGTNLSSVDAGNLERKLKQAIMDFEPRILADSLRIEILVAGDQMSQNSLSFKIEGDLWAQPLPVHLFIRSDLDLETGEVTVKEIGG
ncbi:type VI secretion system baseplate subunit TssE [Methylomonas sp. SURF-2]|uniref:Type VI secretion system baseplate subunit TssE n=1 Tax=Methylomonas subterranea TaxID=2952225 RepID=A0ABT1TKR7_9GAMM|nr:type VI secretion system baseplate subunit TssE [Methylomonas sp. SURF-2]MCQ8105334.1 type VI secretion system baseplate subunit TssE [Methylomonas sp. SURF-2]